MEFSLESNGFLTRTQLNGEKIRTKGHVISTLDINLENLDPQIPNQIIHSLNFKDINPLIKTVIGKFQLANGPCIKTYWLKDHSSLVELTKPNSPLSPPTPSLLIDVTLLKSNVENEVIPLLYKLGIVYGMCRYVSLTDSESLSVTFTLLNQELRLKIKQFLDTTTGLDHDKSLSNCLNTINDFGLDQVLKGESTQLVLLMKQMSISLPYSRDDFKKASSILDIKKRREECFKIIRKFDIKIELNNIQSVLRKLSYESKYRDFKMKLIVGRESRAFGNQAYLFANSNMVHPGTELTEAIRTLERFINESNSKFLIELKPSLSRLKSLFQAPLTQFKGVLLNLRESVDIFLRKTQKEFDLKRQIQIEKLQNVSVGLKTLFGVVKTEPSDLIGLESFCTKITEHINRIEKLIYESRTSRCAFSVLLQRPSYTGSDRFRLNELETKPEQEESLQKLVRQGGDNLYMSPCYDWITEATDLIEAVPLFIYERVVFINDKPETIFEVDQEGLEVTIRQIADYWAENIEKTIASEHVSLARSLLIKLDPELNTRFDTLGVEHKEIAELLTLEGQEDRVSRLALLLERVYDNNVIECERIVEEHWSRQEFISRKDSLEIFLERNKQHQLLQDSEGLDIEDRFKVYERQRDLPAFHLLTTEAPGLIEGFITVVLEEEMAMRNVIKAYGLEKQCKDQSLRINKNLVGLAKKVIHEFNYEPKVDQYVSNGSSYEQAVIKVMNENLPIQDQVACLAILMEVIELENDKLGHDIEDYWVQQLGLDLRSIKSEALEILYERNKHEHDFTGLENLDPNELEAEIKLLIRSRAFEILVEKYPELYLPERRKRYIRDHTSLIQTTCRRLVISKNGLNDKLSHPLYNYTSGLTDGCKPNGLKKRYHLIYAPSRVNLGKDERKSVEMWSQFLGVTDPLAAKHAQKCYELINYSPVVRNIREAENLKVSENQWTALVRSCRNVQALFVERLGIGDIEDLSYQFNQRGGLNFGSLKESEGYNSGPTAGYCIPKDLLFKLFVGAFQDSRKLSQIGIPKLIHKPLQELMIEIYNGKKNFDSVLDWESWACQRFLTEDYLNKRLTQSTKEFIGKFIKLTESKIVFHLNKLIQVLGDTGVPNPLMNNERDLDSVLWSSWADYKITLGGEQVNRSTVFKMTREIFQSASKSRELNPNADIVSDDSLRVQMYGVYKGDDDEPPPPDVRYSWTMRAFQILSGHYQKVADSLDIEGQIIARLSCIGFQPDSLNPLDIESKNYLTKKFNIESLTPELIKRLKKAFPCHRTVGDITITVVPGVDSEDLLGFSAETMTLLGDEADKARHILESLGKMSFEQMKANSILRRKFPEEWTPLNQLTLPEIEKIRDLIGESIHPLVLRLRGPGTSFLNDLQGQDIVVFSITHPEILSLDPANLRDLMLVGRPNSALCALDFVSQGRHRCWSERDVMLWYAAARGLKPNGRLELDWSKRGQRQSVYKAFGTGYDQYLPLLGTNLRSEVVRQENRAIEIWKSAKCVTESDDIQKSIEDFRNLYKKHLKSLSPELLHLQQISQRLLMSKRFKPRDKIILDSLEDLTSSPVLTRVNWLCLGGLFLLNGTPEHHQHKILEVIQKCSSIINPEVDDSDLISTLIVPQLTGNRINLGEKKGEMFSVKASEDCQVRAVTRRAQLVLESNHLNSIHVRTVGFNEISETNDILPKARESMLNLSKTPEVGYYPKEVVDKTYGEITRLTVLYLELIIKKSGHQDMLTDLNEIFTSGQINIKIIDKFCGTYENHGHVSKLFESFQNIEEVFNCCELLYFLIALDKTSEFLTCKDDKEIWRKLSEFFSKTIDDHFYEYNPWFLDPKRGSTFVHYYDYLGIIRPEYSDELYKISWETHRVLYQYFYNLILNHSDLRIKIPNESERDLFLGRVEQDKVIVTAIGNRGVKGYESLWRCYNQLREISFMRNDGFEFPIIFNNFDQNVLETQNKVNLAILSPIGRTHYSRALMESTELDDNIFITRSGFITDSFLFIQDAHFYMSKTQFLKALKHKGVVDEEAEKLSNQVPPKGIRCAALFTQPVLIGCCIAHHHHPLEIPLSKIGYPSTDKSPFLYDLTYNKSLYPLIYSDDLLPPQIDWFQSETSLLPEDKAIENIKERLKTFVAKYPIIICKGSAESGARNLSRFDIYDDQSLDAAARFIFEVSKGQNVTIQRAILSTPLTWMSQTGVKKFLDRQINEHGVSVNVDKYPKDFIYGTLRVIMSSGLPEFNDLDNVNNWEASHLLSLCSLQTATNVGRQGTLEILSPEMIHSKFRDRFINDLVETSRKVMSITSKFGPKYWNVDSILQSDKILAFKNRRIEVPEKDACGCPTWWPRYLMLDLIPEPIFIDSNGQELINAQLVDIEVNDDEYVFTVSNGVQSQQARISTFKFWLLEPNVGIGLWPNYSKREQIRCTEIGDNDHRKIGVSDRIVLRNFLKAGNEFLKTKQKVFLNVKSVLNPKKVEPPSPLASILDNSLIILAKTYGLIAIRKNQVSIWLKEALRSVSSLDQSPLKLKETLNSLLTCLTKQDILYCKRKDHDDVVPSIDVNESDLLNWLSNETYKNRVIDLVIDSVLSEPLTPCLQVSPEPTLFSIKSVTFAVVSEKLTLMTHQVYPFVIGRGNSKINVIGMHTSWFIPSSNLAKRAIVFDLNSNVFIESDLQSPLVIDYCFIVELNQENEVQTHKRLCQEYESLGITVINPQSYKADDKKWLREHKDFNTPRHIYELNENTVRDFVSTCPKGVILQPSCDSTESSETYFFTETKSILEKNVKNPMLSEFRGNVLFNQTHRLVLRFNVSGFHHVTVAGYVSESRVIGLKGTGSNLNGYCERLDKILNNLYTESTCEKVTVTMSQWNGLVNTARSVAFKLGFGLIGIDMIIESNEGRLDPFVLEVNSRPGTLIFGEQVVFKDGEIESVMSAPVDDNFWTSMISRPIQGTPKTLLEWKRSISSGSVSKLLDQRYPNEFIQDRLNSIEKTIDDAILNSFDVNLETVFLFTNGRDRYFGGHTDFLGLGGPTINATSRNEILAVCQLGQDSLIQVTNSDPDYKNSVFELKEMGLKLQLGDKVWDPADWVSYIKGSLAHMLTYEGVKDKIKGFRIHFNSTGILKLESGVGTSSSSALTSALVLGVNQIFNLGLTNTQMCETDYGEFYLGKSAGCADKTCILNSVDRNLVFVSSIPERVITSLLIRPKLVVLMVDSKIPRLNSLKGKHYLRSRYNEDKTESIFNWAEGIMKTFGSFVFKWSLEQTVKALSKMVDLKELVNSTDFLLRDLCVGGRLEKSDGFKDKFKRYNLIFKLLKLLPEEAKVMIGGRDEVIYPRKATLYGLSEIERCYEYVELMKTGSNLSRLFDLVKWSHNGDRACLDYRRDFKPTAWDEKSRVTDEILDEWINNENEDLCNKVGGFERSLPEIDEWADEMDKKFEQMAALRVSAAGLGGNLCIHAIDSVTVDVFSWLSSKGLSAKRIKPGPSYKLI